eukprot:m.173366 g.173366  ORF g.173366 m.173366 type:complete len:309 (+) comp14846_c0_seq1:1864-2790(+)
MHPGEVMLERSTRAQVTKYRGTLAIARWLCCGEVALSTWCEGWDVQDSMGRQKTPCPIPSCMFTRGCGKWDAAVAAHGQAVAPGCARLAQPMPSPRRSGRSSNSSPSSGQELVYYGPEHLSVEEIMPTQRYVNLTTFTTPDGLKNVFDVMMELIDPDCGGYPYTLKSTVDLFASPPWPQIRVAESEGTYYSIDNRRLFMLKVLGVSDVLAEEVAWMHEFDSKLRQDKPSATEKSKHSRTNDTGVEKTRQRLDAMLQHRLAERKLEADEAALVKAMKKLRRRYKALQEELTEVRAEKERLAEAKAVNLP